MLHYLLYQFSSVTQSCPTLCDPMDCNSTPGFPVHDQLPGFTQTHVHWVSAAIQPSHPLSSPFSPAPNPSQHQSLFQWVNSLHEVAKVLEFLSALASFLPKKSQGWSHSEWTGWISLQSKGLSRVSNTTVQKHQFFGTQPSSQSNSHIHTWPQEKPQPWLDGHSIHVAACVILMPFSLLDYKLRMGRHDSHHQIPSTKYIHATWV